jgi:hypothetical protein
MSKQKQVIVSLTSFPAAIPFAIKAIQSILRGSVMPDKLVLYLTFSQFPDEKIPHELQELMDIYPLFEVRCYDDDIRSYRKLIPALIDFPDDIIVTIDDDVSYHKGMLNSLLHWHKLYPDMIIAHRTKRLKLNAPYKKWCKYRWYWFLIRKMYITFRTVQTGVGGVLYPPNVLKVEMLNPELFKKLAPTTDDIWFWAAAVANDTKIVPVPFGIYNKPRGLGKPKSLSLKTVNFKTGTDLNRTAIERIFENYPIIKKKIENETNNYTFFV